MKAYAYIGYTFLLAALLWASGCTHRFEVAEDTPAGNIDALWRMIDEKYCFVEEKGVDWNAVRAPYIARAEAINPAAKDAHLQLFDLMEEMLDVLHDGHVNVYTPFDVSSSQAWYEGYPACFDRDIQRRYIADARYAGGMYYTTFAADSIGYIYYPSFQTAFGAGNIYYILSSFRDCKGLILDVRGNGGGSLEYAYALAAMFTERDTLVGYWQHKSGTARDAYSDLEPLYVRADDMPVKWLRPTIVLQDRHSYSATNFFVNAMRYMPYVLLLGGVSGGGAGMPMSYELPNGWIVRFSSVKMYDAAGVSIEEGIEPHVRDSLVSTDRDDLIEHAIQIIHRLYEQK